MIFANLNSITFIIFFILLFYWIIVSFLIFKHNWKKSIILLFLSYFFIILNLFDIRWEIKDNYNEATLWNALFIVDKSNSVNVKDIIYSDNYISRLDASIKIIDNYISENINNNYWLLLFSWESIEVLPLINDYTFFSNTVSSIKNYNIPKKWSDFKWALNSIVEYFKYEEKWWIAIILTDWWDDEIKLEESFLKDIEKLNIKILILGLWSYEWSKIPVWNDYLWREIYKVYSGETVISKLNPSLNNFNNENIIFKDIVELDNSTLSNINQIINNNLWLETNISVSNRMSYIPYLISVAFFLFLLYLVLDNKKQFLWRKY